MILDTALRTSLEWRCIGPHRGGRCVAVAGDPHEQMTFYFGACAGGVWKTTDGGTYWENISDGFFKTAAVSAIPVAECDPNDTEERQLIAMTLHWHRYNLGNRRYNADGNRGTQSIVRFANLTGPCIQ